jgi:hypothetical protein
MRIPVPWHLTHTGYQQFSFQLLGAQWYFTVVLICVPLVTTDVSSFLMCSFSFHISSLDEVFVQNLPILKLTFVSLLLNFESSL